MSVTREQAEVLRARGYRPENSLLDGPRVVLDDHEAGVYTTLVPDPTGEIHWAVWSQSQGEFLAGGHDANALVAADQAMAWIFEEWA